MVTMASAPMLARDRSSRWSAPPHTNACLVCLDCTILAKSDGEFSMSQGRIVFSFNPREAPVHQEDRESEAAAYCLTTLKMIPAMRRNRRSLKLPERKNLRWRTMWWRLP